MRDQTTEFDLDERQDGYDLTSEEDVARHLEANRVVTQLTQMLDMEVDEPVLQGDGTPELDNKGLPKTRKVRLFDESDLGPEVYQPLVRQGLMAETFVPDKYSETREMLDGSFDAYKNHLDEEGVKHWALRGENWDLGFSLVSNSIGMLGSIGQGIAGPLDVNPKEMEPGDGLAPGLDYFEEIGKAENIIELSGQIWDMFDNFGVGAGTEVYELGDTVVGKVKESRKKIPKQLASKLAEMLAAGIASTLGDAVKNPWKLSVMASSTYGSTVKTTVITKHLMSFDEAEDKSAVVTKVVTELGGGVEVVLKGFKEGNDVLARAGKKAKKDLITNVSADSVADALDAANMSQAFQAIVDGAKIAIAGVLGDSQVKAVLDANAETINADLGKQLGVQMTKEMADEEKRAKDELQAIAGEKDEAKRAGLIDKKILELERLQKILEWSEKIVNLGFDVVSKFIGPMAIAGSAFKLSLSITRAALQAGYLITFLETKKQMLNAASPYSAPVRNFVENAGFHMVHHQINAACELVNMIGAIIETVGSATGPGAAAAVTTGKIISSVASASASTEAIMYELAKRYKLEQAWKAYRLALTRSENRKLGLIAMKKNPTLAKYAVAWGAVIKKDPLVKDFLGWCHLDEMTLKDPKTNVDKVVKYLEVRFSEDIEVKGREALPTKWEPTKIELTASCWAGTKRRAEQTADLIPTDTRSLDLALAAFDKAYKALSEAFKPNANLPEYPANEDVDSGLKELDAVALAFNQYRPKRQSGKGTIMHQQMKDVVKRFTGALQRYQDKIEGMKAPT